MRPTPTRLAAALFAAAGAAPLSAQCFVDSAVASDAAAGDHYGEAVSAWGELVVTGAEFADSATFDEGHVYVLRRQGDAWEEVAVLTHADAGPDHRLGHATAVHGGRVVAGARYNDGKGYGTGSAYVFEEVAGQWVQTAKLLPFDVTLGDLFGNDVGIHGDRIVVGAHGDDDRGTNAGAAHLFQLQNGVWKRTHKLFASDAAPEDRFGEYLGISGDRIVVGAIANDGAADNAGAAYVFEIQADGSVLEVAKLVAPDAAEFDRLGTDVAVDGDLAVVGATLAGAELQGAAYVFERAADGAWGFLQKLLPEGTPAGAGFGRSVALAGGRIAAGAPGLALGDLAGAGAAYLYERRSDGWFVEVAVLRPKSAELGYDFGDALALLERGVAVGAGGSALAAGFQSGELLFFAGDGASPAHVDACPGSVSVSGGGVQTLRLFAGAEHAGRPYLVLGSLSGSTPGTPLGDALLPLVVDAYTRWTAHPALSPVAMGFGLVDPAGQARAEFALPPGSPPALAGLVATHAFVVLAPPDRSPALVSDPVEVVLVD